MHLDLLHTTEIILKELNFNEFFLVPMDIYAIEKFVDYWHKAILIESGLDEDGSTNLYIQKLLKSFRDYPTLFRLATNPLLCAIICALNYDRKMHLPKDRIDLYEACTKLLMESRDIFRDVNISEYPKLTYKQKQIIIGDLAYWMLRNGYSTINIDQANKRIESSLRNMQFVFSEQNVCLVCQMLVERSGIIRQVTPTSIDFIHRTFQEYMAAFAITEI